MPKSISSLATGLKVRDTQTKYNGVAIGWVIGDKNHVGYPANSVTLVAESILTLKCYDAIESGGGNSRNSYGNNRWIYANIRQWLNKSGTGWYASQHSYDQAPTNANVWSNYNEYDAEAGFKTGFSKEFLAAILPTTLTVAKPTCDGGESETCTDDIFLLSVAEVNLGAENGITEGAALPIFTDNNSRKKMPTAQAVQKSEYTDSSLAASKPWWWWLRSPGSGNGNIARNVNSDGTLNYGIAYYGGRGVLPALNLKSDILVSDSPDSEGYYTIVWNNAPTTPGGITVPESVRSGKAVAVSWAASVDSDNDPVSYELERQSNGGGWSKIYDGSATSYSDTGVTAEMNTVAYRVRAKDNRGGYSAYNTSQTRTVVHNVDPTIDGKDQNLGAVTSPPSYTYQVGDADVGDTLEVVESLDGQEVNRIPSAQRAHSYTFALSQIQFAGLKGEHKMTVTVTDSAGNSVTRTITFSRNVGSIDLDWKMDDTGETAAQKVLISLRYLAAEEGVTLQVCNNFNDEAPTWETATPGLKHIFSNSAKTAGTFAVGVRVKIVKTVGYDTVALYSLSGSYI